MKMFTLLQSAEVVEVAATEANDAVQAIAEQPAEPASAEAPVKPAGGGMSMWVMLALMFAVMWFFMIRPQKKQQKELQNFRDSLKNGDKVVTIGGLYGTVAEIKDASVLIEVDKNVKIRVSKQALVKDFSDPQQ
jgi:preprotein translocase subunit YajC